MSRTAVLLCGDAGVGCEHLARERCAAGEHCVIVAALCERPDVAATALRESGASRVVLGVCEERVTSDHVRALRRAGADPFGIESVVIGGRPPAEAAVLLTAAVARLRALPAGERGRPSRPTREVSRRALFTIASALEHAPIAVLDNAACIGTANCSLCIPACPESAIDAAGPRPRIDSAACTACGKCVSRCPAGALRLAGSSAAQIEVQLAQLLPGMAGIVFACASARAVAPPGWGLVELPTLELVTPGWILQVRSRGADVRLVGCGRECCAGADEVQARAARIIAGTGRPRRGADDIPIRLREPFATADGVARIADRDRDGDANMPLVIEDPGSALGILDVDGERCTLCGACATACPTSALRFAETPEAVVLRHDPGACVGCDRCAQICPETVLEVRRGIDIARVRRGPFDLVRAECERCSACGSELPPRQMRRRVAELLGHPDARLDLCRTCSLTSQPRMQATEYDRLGTSP